MRYTVKISYGIRYTAMLPTAGLLDVFFECNAIGIVTTQFQIPYAQTECLQLTETWYVLIGHQFESDLWSPKLPVDSF